MYKLVYIKGISRLDTLRFNSKQEQYNYFNSLSGVSIDEYYPPHFTNTIKLDISDVNYIEDKYNYLIITIKNKLYFYFIDDINYINEDVYNINITMDTIQTYMFDLNVYNVNFDRLSIKRWNDDGSINRNYLRENLSDVKDTFNIKDYKELNNKNYIPILIVKTTQALNTTDVFFNYYLDTFENDSSVYNIFSGLKTKVIDNMYIYVLPLLDYIGLNMIDNDTQNTYYYEAQQVIDYFKNQAGCVSIDIYHSEQLCKILGLSLNITNNTISFNNHYYTHDTYEMVAVSFPTQSQVPSYVLSLQQLIIRADIDYYKLSEYNFSEFTRNTNLNVNYSSNYIPQLIDENYFQLEFGEKLGYTSYPLHKMETTTLTLNCIYEILTGSRAYYINDNNIVKETQYTRIYAFKDIYATVIQNNTIEEVAIYNDATQQYKSINHGTLTTGLKLARQNALFDLLSASTGQFIYNPSMLTQQFTNANFLKSMYNIDMKLKTTMENLKYTPDTVKQGNNSMNDLICKSFIPYYRVMMVKDLEKIGKTYELYGYKVDKYVDNLNSIFDYCNIRYYYNIIKTINIEFDLNIMTTTNIINDIRVRFEDGLRIWNNPNNIMDFTYDNVENDFIE